MRKWSLANLIFLTSCISNSPKEQVKEIVGTWYAHEPFVSWPEKSKYIGYVCFNENGEYNFFDLSSLDTVNAVKINGMQRNAGSWSLVEDSLIIQEMYWGFLNDTAGIGSDWQPKMEMKTHEEESRVRIRVQGDSLHFYRDDGTIVSTTRQNPRMEISSVCQD